MKVIYISSPFTHGDKTKNVEVQIEAAHRIMDMGHCPIAPNLTYFMDVQRKRPYEEWMMIELELVERCDVVLRLPGFSPGADREVARAGSIGIPIAFGWGDLADVLDD